MKELIVRIIMVLIFFGLYAFVGAIESHGQETKTITVIDKDGNIQIIYVVED